MELLLSHIKFLASNICGSSADETRSETVESNNNLEQDFSEYRQYVQNLGISQAHLIADVSKLSSREAVDYEEYKNLAASHRNLISEVKTLRDRLHFAELCTHKPWTPKNGTK